MIATLSKEILTMVYTLPLYPPEFEGREVGEGTEEEKEALA